MSNKKTIPRVCLTCGKDFLATRDNVNKGYGWFCSRSCHAKSRTGKDNPNWKGGSVLQTCLACGKDFLANRYEVNRGRGLYCSHSCARAGKANAMWGRAGKSHPMWGKTGKTSPGWKGGITPPQDKARDIVRRALKNGELVRQPCELCGSTANINAHHDNYSKPLAVRWLCRGCHMKEHSRIKKKKQHDTNNQ